MGQYYKTVFIEQVGNKIRIIGWLCAKKYDSGWKLMEHSWVGNNFVSAIEFQISPEGAYPNGQRIVWAGDYADKEGDTEDNFYHMCGDYDGDDVSMLRFPEKDSNIYRYVVNHTKKLFVDKENTEDDKIHPLPLLTCEGNGRGLGDYITVNQREFTWTPGKDPQELVGSWARDIVAVTREPPIGYLEIYFDLTELTIGERESHDEAIGDDDNGNDDDDDDDDEENNDDDED